MNVYTSGKSHELFRMLKLRQNIYLKTQAIKRLQQEKKAITPISDKCETHNLFIATFSISTQLWDAVGKTENSYTDEVKTFAVSAYYKTDATDFSRESSNYLLFHQYMPGCQSST
uniref:Uncharacterized protein n=1 Tax=Lepeophtheirus salmonis TaxID=72036 RepID=A0A0K2T5Y3_LEPSM